MAAARHNGLLGLSDDDGYVDDDVYDDPLPAYRIAAVQPTRFSEAKRIGELFRDGVPVIINVSQMDDADARRVVDFASGLIFGLHGSIERVAHRVFLLVPEDTQLTR